MIAHCRTDEGERELNRPWKWGRTPDAFEANGPAGAVRLSGPARCAHLGQQHRADGNGSFVVRPDERLSRDSGRWSVLHELGDVLATRGRQQVGQAEHRDQRDGDAAERAAVRDGVLAAVSQSVTGPIESGSRLSGVCFLKPRIGRRIVVPTRHVLRGFFVLTCSSYGRYVDRTPGGLPAALRKRPRRTPMLAGREVR